MHDYRYILNSREIRRRDREREVVAEILAWLTVVGIFLAGLVAWL